MKTQEMPIEQWIEENRVQLEADYIRFKQEDKVDFDEYAELKYHEADLVKENKDETN